MQVFTAARLLTPSGVITKAYLFVEAGRIVEVGSREGKQIPGNSQFSDLGDALIAPGYLDLHIHGSAGADVMDDGADALPTIERFLTHCGVTSYFPTTVTAPIDKILRALERLAGAIETRQQRPESGVQGEKKGVRAIPLGIHLEGPFISHAKRGVHPPENLMPPKLATFERFWEAARGNIRMITIAPELDGAEELIASAAKRGVCVSLGHSAADLDSSKRAIAAGARHATHTFNAMRPIEHREPGILGAVLTDERVSADLIADGIHLDPTIVKLVAEAKGLDGTVLITDATAATGMPEGRYHLGALEVEVRDGKCMANGRLAGSVLTMDLAVRNLVKFAGWDLSEAAAAASRNPARTARFDKKGRLEVGADADFVILNDRGEVVRTFIGGVESA